MTKPTVAWCTVCGSDSKSQIFTELLMEIAETYDWVTEVHVQITDKYGEDWRLDKAHIHMGSYGRSYSETPGRGGFMGIHAFNDALRWGRMSGCDWVLFSDNDEYFLDSFFDHILAAHDNGRKAIWAARWHLVDPLHSVDPIHSTDDCISEHPVWRHPGDHVDLPLMCDPNLAGWSNSLQRFGFEEPAVHPDPSKNWHTHQGQVLYPQRYDDPFYYHVVEDVGQVHVRHLLYPSREAEWTIEKVRLGHIDLPEIPYDYELPGPLTAAWNYQYHLRDNEPEWTFRGKLSDAERHCRISPNAKLL